MPELDLFAYFTPLCIFIFILVCFLQFAIRGVGCCPTQSQYPTRRRRFRPDSLIWNTACSAVPNASMMHAEFGFPTQRLTENHPRNSFPGNDAYSRREFARQVAQGQAVYTPDFWELDARRLLGCPPKYEDAMKETSSGAPPEYLGERGEMRNASDRWEAELEPSRLSSASISLRNSSISLASTNSTGPTRPIQSESQQQALQQTSSDHPKQLTVSISKPTNTPLNTNSFISRSLSNDLPNRALSIPENQLVSPSQRSRSCTNVIIINMN